MAWALGAETEEEQGESEKERKRPSWGVLADWRCTAAQALLPKAGSGAGPGQVFLAHAAPYGSLLPPCDLFHVLLEGGS